MRRSVPGTMDSRTGAMKTRTDEGAARTDNTPPPGGGPPARSQRIWWALLLVLGTALAEYRDLHRQPGPPIRKRPPPVGTAPRKHWKDAVDMNAAAPPLRRNPSAWPHRILTAVVAACRAGVAAYMGLYQLHLISSVWDPVFGRSTEHMLTSRLSQVADFVFHVPDAVLGAIGYASEVIFSLSGCTRRWQHRPWLVVLLGLTVLGIACVSAALVCAQGLIVKSWCFLCLVSAAISFTLVALVAEEVYACLRYLRRVWRQSHRPAFLWNTFWGRASDVAERAALQKE